VSYPIQLSLAGDGRLVILTWQTVRKAFFQFAKVNPEYTGREKYRLDYPLHDPVEVIKFTKKKYTEVESTITDALHRSYLGRKANLNPARANGLLYLHHQDIQKVERQINKYILDRGLALVEDEGRLLKGYDICTQVGKNRQKVIYIVRYGMFFILEPISRQEVIKMRNVDLFIQDAETYDFHLVRFYGVLLSSLKSEIKLLFSHRLDYSRQWTWTTAQFKPRQIFRIIEIYPCPGFCFI
jgi:hypothetical protein